MKRKILGLLIIAVITLGATKNVYATGDVYYTNPNGVELTQKEYEFLTTLFADAYVDLITQDEYDEYLDDGLFDSTIEIETYTEPALPLHYPGASIQSDTHGTQDKTLQIGKSCTANYCMISLFIYYNISLVIGVYTS